MRRIISAILLLSVGFASPAGAADWGGSDITNIIGNVEEIREEVIGSGKTRAVINDLRDQLSDMRAKGLILRESFADLLTWLKKRQGPYRQFVGDDTPRCEGTTDCALFRQDLIVYFGAIAAHFLVARRVDAVGGDHLR